MRKNGVRKLERKEGYSQCKRMAVEYIRRRASISALKFFPLFKLCITSSTWLSSFRWLSVNLYVVSLLPLIKLLLCLFFTLYVDFVTLLIMICLYCHSHAHTLPHSCSFLSGSTRWFPSWLSLSRRQANRHPRARLRFSAALKRTTVFIAHCLFTFYMRVLEKGLSKAIGEVRWKRERKGEGDWERNRERETEREIERGRGRLREK